MTFAPFERRWLAATMSGFTGPEGELALREGEVDYLSTADVMNEGSSRKARLGLHLAVWLAALAPVWMLGRAQTIDEVSPATRTELLARMVSHRLFFVRGLTTLLKLAASLAMMRSPGVRARTRYDRAPAQPARRALPLSPQQG